VSRHLLVLSHAPVAYSSAHPLLSSSQFVHTFCVSQCPGLCTALHGQSHKSQMGVGAVNISLDLLAVLLLMQPGLWLAFIAMRATAQSSPSLLFAGTSRAFSAKCRGLTQQLATQHQAAACSPLSSLSVGWGGEMDKRGNSWIEIKTV